MYQSNQSLNITLPRLVLFRVGVFGFLRANSVNLKGNYGMIDQIEGMKWGNKNIAR